MSAQRWQSAHNALRELWCGKDITAQLEQIYAAEPGLLHSILPQLNNYLLHAVTTACKICRPGGAMAC